jgi:hypothetical protein
MTWNRPHHLSDTEAERWIKAELRRLAAGGSVLEHPECAQWLHELQGLEMRPVAAVLEATDAVS